MVSNILLHSLAGAAQSNGAVKFHKRENKKRRPRDGRSVVIFGIPVLISDPNLDTSRQARVS